MALSKPKTMSLTNVLPTVRSFIRHRVHVFYSGDYMMMKMMSDDLYFCSKQRTSLQLEIRSMERGICPIAVLFCIKTRSFFNI